jgi:hypothetical membrane protein
MPRTHDSWLVSGAIWGPGLFIAAWILSGLLVAGYSPVEEAISDLAAVGAPGRVPMTLGFAAYGIGVGLSVWPLRRVIGKAAAIALGLNAVSTLGVMLTPIGSSTATDFRHAMFAALAYVSLALVGPLAARPLQLRGFNVPLVPWAVGLVTIVLLAGSLGGTTPGMFQRIGLTTTHIWLMALGIAVVTGQLRAEETLK